MQLTHRNLWLNATTFGWHTGVSDRDVYLHTLPMFHCNGWGMPYAVTGMGGATSCCARSTAPRSCAASSGTASRCCAGRRPSSRAVLDAAASVGRARSPAATGCAWSSPARRRPTQTIERIETELGWEFIQIYGLTETSPLLTMNRTRAEWDDLAAGRARAASSMRAGAPALGVRLRRRRQRRGARPVERRLEGYWEQPDATADALADGWFHTGDGGFIDDEGYLTISDRKKDVIISGGENVSLDRGRGRAVLSTRRSPRWRSSACPTRSGARR